MCIRDRTSFANRLCRDSFDAQQPGTIGVEYFQTRLPDGRRLRIWDLSGDPRFLPITRTYMAQRHNLVCLVHPQGEVDRAMELFGTYRVAGGTAPVMAVATAAGGTEAPEVSTGWPTLTVDTRVVPRAMLVAQLVPFLPPCRAPCRTPCRVPSSIPEEPPTHTGNLILGPCCHPL